MKPGTLVEVVPDGVGVNDVIELAEALIEEHGNVKGDSGSEKGGWSIHGAIGEAARRATDSNAKDSVRARPFRDKAATLLMETDPEGRGEFVINDDAQNVGEVLAAMRLARGAV